MITIIKILAYKFLRVSSVTVRGELDLVRTGVLNGNIRNSYPPDELLALETRQALHPTVLDDRRHHFILPRAAVDGAEYVRLALLPQPHESSILVVADLDDASGEGSTNSLKVRKTKI
ncbi:hypothetical protein OROGR_000969 [Orobanche gracilis]